MIIETNQQSTYNIGKEFALQRLLTALEEMMTLTVEGDFRNTLMDTYKDALVEKAEITQALDEWMEEAVYGRNAG